MLLGLKYEPRRSPIELYRTTMWDHDNVLAFLAVLFCIPSDLRYMQGTIACP